MTRPQSPLQAQSGGTISLYGQPKRPWTQLLAGAPALQGSETITVEGPVPGWQVRLRTVAGRYVGGWGKGGASGTQLQSVSALSPCVTQATPIATSKVTLSATPKA